MLLIIRPVKISGSKARTEGEESMYTLIGGTYEHMDGGPAGDERFCHISLRVRGQALHPISYIFLNNENLLNTYMQRTFKLDLISLILHACLIPLPIIALRGQDFNYALLLLYGQFPLWPFDGLIGEGTIIFLAI